MNEITYQKMIKMGISSIGGIIYSIFQPSHELIQALCIIILIDFVVGVYQSFNSGLLFSPKKFLGKIKEIGLFIVVFAAASVINPLWAQYGIKAQTVANMFLSMYGMYHFLSILQNAGKLGFPLAAQFQRFIESKASDLSNLSKKEEVANEDKK